MKAQRMNYLRLRYEVRMGENELWTCKTEIWNRGVVKNFSNVDLERYIHKEWELKWWWCLWVNEGKEETKGEMEQQSKYYVGEFMICKCAYLFIDRDAFKILHELLWGIVSNDILDCDRKLTPKTSYMDWLQDFNYKQ